MINDFILDWWDGAAKTVKDEIEDRTGQRPTVDNQVKVRVRSFEESGVEIDCAVMVFNGEPVAFLLIDWGEPAVKITYL